MMQLVVALHGLLGSSILATLVNLLRPSKLLIRSGSTVLLMLHLLWTLLTSLLMRLLRAMTLVALLHLLIMTVRRRFLRCTRDRVGTIRSDLGRNSIGWVSRLM